MTLIPSQIGQNELTYYGTDTTYLLQHMARLSRSEHNIPLQRNEHCQQHQKLSTCTSIKLTHRGSNRLDVHRGLMFHHYCGSNRSLPLNTICPASFRANNGGCLVTAFFLRETQGTAPVSTFIASSFRSSALVGGSLGSSCVTGSAGAGIRREVRHDMHVYDITWL